MKRIQLKIKALSPLAIGRQKPGGSVSEAEDYIPGTVIRGAIAAQILRQSPQRSENLSEGGGDFQALFLGETPAIFQNAYPATIDTSKGTLFRPEIRVLPATAVSSKTKPGFRVRDLKKPGVFDTLIDRFLSEQYGYLYEPNCPTDGGRVEVYSGFYSQDNGTYVSHAAKKRLLTRVGINRQRATAEDDILYSIEVLNESESKEKNPKLAIYSGAILVSDEPLAELLSRFINAKKKDFRIGGSASRGLGRVQIEATTGDFKPKIESEINKFNDHLKNRWEEWKKIFKNPQEELTSETTYFTLDIQSDAILKEQWRRTTVITEAMLRQFAGVEEDPSLQLHAAYSSYDYRSGWNAAWGLMKDVELITNKGAVYLFSTTQKDVWIKALEELELKGVGERTSEGFGQVKICNDFHLIFREKPA